MLTERDTLRIDGTIDWRVVRAIAKVRAFHERHIDILVAAYGAPIKAPADVAFHNVREWRCEAANRALDANPDLKLTPYWKIYRSELRQVWSAARALQRARQRLLDDLRGSVALIDGAAA